MTRASIREYNEAVRWRYLQAPEKAKTKILDEFTKVTGYHRKAIIRLLHRVNQPNANRKRGRLFSTTKPSSLLKSSIPIRTFADWHEDRPSFLEVDLVSHCGESSEGFYKKNDSCHVEDHRCD